MFYSLKDKTRGMFGYKCYIFTVLDYYNLNYFYYLTKGLLYDLLLRYICYHLNYYVIFL
jgi:hypothetical protein